MNYDPIAAALAEVADESIGGVPRRELRMCVPAPIPDQFAAAAAWHAYCHNPAALDPLHDLICGDPHPDGLPLHPASIAMMVDGRWRGGQVLRVAFRNGDARLRDRVLGAMRLWSKYCSITYERATGSQADVLVGFYNDGASYAYLGSPSSALIAQGYDTIHYGWDLSDDGELIRVCCRETGHNLNLPHEHQRQDFIDQLDPEPTYQFFGGPPNGWSRQQVREQVLTGMDPRTVELGTPEPDPTSIMMYGFAAALTRRKVDIPGGKEINARDGSMVGARYGLPGGTPTGPTAPPIPPVAPPPVAPPPYPLVELGRTATQAAIPGGGDPARFTLRVPGAAGGAAAVVTLQAAVNPRHMGSFDLPVAPAIALEGRSGAAQRLNRPGRAAVMISIPPGDYTIDVRHPLRSYAGPAWLKATPAA